ncbi:MAG: hypothetical protein ACYTFG_20170 [Planctomycetota bacterium]|jgi:hypothetical protein
MTPDKPKLRVIDGGKLEDEEPVTDYTELDEGYKPVTLPKELGYGEGEIVADEEYEEVEETSMEGASAVHVNSADVPVMECAHIANFSKPFRNKQTGQIYREFWCLICNKMMPMVKALVDARSRPIPITRKDLKGRTMVCACKKEIPSDTDGITFLRYLPKQEKDIFYCGHMGWDPRLCRRMVMTPGERIMEKGKNKKKRKKER